MWSYYTSSEEKRVSSPHSPSARGGESASEIPLPEVGREHVVDVQADIADHHPGVGRGHDHRLVEHGRGLSLTVRPRLRLPRPRVSWAGRAADNAVADCPPARLRVAV